MNSINDFFNKLYGWFDDIGTKKIIIDDEALEQFFEPDFSMFVNGKCLISDRNTLKPHFQSLINQPGDIKFILPFEDIIIEPPKVVIHYQIEYQHENMITLTQVIGIYLLSTNGKAQAKCEINHSIHKFGVLR
jgi:hypothetical protein